MNYKKKNNELGFSFWEDKYKENATGWDIGGVSTPLQTYFDQLSNKNLHILIPGAGNSYEAEYLHNSGFKNVDVIDLVSDPLENLLERTPTFPKGNLFQGNFFEHTKKYSLIIEQTFFCALHPSERENYAKKMHNLLEDKGKVVGLLFDVDFEKDHPPFGGSLEEYLSLFSKYFNIQIIEKSYNSVKPRVGTELFFIFEKK
jgi:hypothetical protein